MLLEKQKFLTALMQQIKQSPEDAEGQIGIDDRLHGLSYNSIL